MPCNTGQPSNARDEGAWRTCGTHMSTSKARGGKTPFSHVYAGKCCTERNERRDACASTVFIAHMHTTHSHTQACSPANARHIRKPSSPQAQQRAASHQASCTPMLAPKVPSSRPSRSELSRSGAHAHTHAHTRAHTHISRSELSRSGAHAHTHAHTRAHTHTSASPGTWPTLNLLGSSPAWSW